jgi:hypothetical protein
MTVQAKIRIYIILLFSLLFSVSVSASRVLAQEADAGPDQTVNEGDTVILDGSNSSPRNSILTYFWKQTGGSPSVILKDVNTAKASFIAPIVGPEGTSLTLQLTVIYFFNSSIVSDTDSTIVNVLFVNDPPVADAGPDQNVEEETTVTLDGSNSSDPDDGIESYRWKQVTGPSVTLSNPQAAKPTFLAPNVSEDGTSLTFELTVTDTGGLKATDTTTVNVTGDNDPPVADAGPDQTVEEETSVTLDGSNSSDPEGENLTYQWKQVAGPSVVLSNPQTAKPNFFAPNVGPNGEALAFELTVIDVGGLKDTNTTTVNVIGDNDAPIADAGPNQTVDEGKKVTLDGSNSTDPEGEGLSYQWSQVAGLPVTLSSTQAAKPTFTALDVGPGGASLTFRLTVTDDGDLKDSDTTIVNVRFVNEPPEADAGPNQAVFEGTEVTLDGSNSTDPEGGELSYRWSQVAGPSVTLSHTQVVKPTFTALDVGPGGASLTFRLTVSDNQGLKDTDTTVVNVIGDNDPPMADAGPDQTVDEENMVTLNGSNSTDPEGERLFYRWKQVAGPSVTLSDPTADQPKFNAPNVAPSGAALKFELTVSDSLGLKDTDDITVNVAGDNDPPTANAGTDQTVDEDSSDVIVLDGSKSSDPDDGIESYRWKQVAGPAVTLSDPKADRPTFATPNITPVGISLTFELTVADVGGLQSADTTIVNVTGDNDPPTANAGTDQTVLEKSTVTLDGSNSSDPDDGIGSYRWKQVAGPAVTFSDPTNDRLTFEAPSFDDTGDQPLIFELIVTDSGGLQSSDSTTVSVSNFEKDNPGASGGGCFIATAAYGSPMERQVMVLHGFRDRYLITNPLGQAFVDLYYAYSPSVADFIAKHGTLKAVVRWSLLPLVTVCWLTLRVGPAPI